LNRFVGEKNWQFFSRNLRIQQKGICENCKVNLSDNMYYLHVHHINQSHYWNSRANCKVLCYGCHSDEPNHAHMKNTDDYDVFLKVKKELIANRTIK